jgi:serine/threonine protein kinase
MPTEIMDTWFVSRQSALICRKQLRPVEHPVFIGKPLSSEKGQAEAFFLTDDRNETSILKKFHNGRALDHGYLTKASTLLPQEPGFVCGTERKILVSGDLVNGRNSYYSKTFGQWLGGTVLMPKVPGCDWGTLADDLRDGNITLDDQQRQTLCMELCRMVDGLEKCQCSHRDLSCGNVFIDVDTGTVYLIDFDSLFHPTLNIPDATTCGTLGYTAPYAWHNGNADAHKTWCVKADRYAMALLIVEILTVAPGTEATEEGGIFDQDELRRQSGKGMTSIMNQLKTQYPRVAEFLQRALNSRSFTDCPGPSEWNHLLATNPTQPWVIPDLSDVQCNSSSDITNILNQRRPAAPIWPAPGLDTMPAPKVEIPAPPTTPSYNIALPADPWAAILQKNRKPLKGI